MSPQVSPPPSLVGTVLDGAYQLTRLISEGAMGTVYEAVQLRLHKRVAVKVMVDDLSSDAEALARFRREVAVTSQLSHPHVIALLDFGAAPSGAPYLVMEYLDGEDLDQRLRRVQRLSVAATVNIVMQTASALSTIHQQGIVHRDLKPANVFLLSLENGDFVKVVDFGISKVKTATTRLTRAFTMVGTPESMSPEQATGRVDEVDHRCDQWALATAAWRMITGSRPFAGDTLTAFLEQVVNAEPPPLRSLVPDVQPDLDVVLRKALSKRKDDRYPSIAAFARAFDTAATVTAKAESAAPANLHMMASPAKSPEPVPEPATSEEATVQTPVTIPPTFTVIPTAIAAPLPPVRTRRGPATAVFVVVAITTLAVGGILFSRGGGPALLRKQYQRAAGMIDPSRAQPPPASRPAATTTIKP